MTRAAGPVAKMFRELVKDGHIAPVDRMEDLRLPGELTVFPTFTTYGTPELPIRAGVDTNAKLEQRSEGDFAASGDVIRVGV